MDAVRRYGVVPLLIAAAVGLELFLEKLPGAVESGRETIHPFLFLWPAVMTAAWFGGFGPGLAATFLSVVAADFLVIEPRYVLGWLDPSQWIWMGMFLALGMSFSLLSDRLHRAKRRVEEQALQLAETDRRKDEFLAMLGHELRNPLAPIRHANRILSLKSPPDAELAWAREIIDRQVEQLARLVDDLLDVSRVAQGKIKLQKKPVELAQVLERAVEISRPLLAEHKHELIERLPDEPLWLDADPMRLAQVIANLLNNAAKYTDERGRIWLSAEREGRLAVMRVRDSGIGIPADMLPRVFDLFAQADYALHRSQGGLGIGLTLVRRLVAMHGGTVEARSDGPGKGSEFIVRLPLREKPPSISARGQTPQALPQRLHSGRRILLVDDNADSTKSLAALLKLKGHEVRTARDGPAAVTEVRDFQPDVVLLDIGLPGVDGYEVARRIRQAPQKQPLLVAMTGYGQDESRQQSRDAGFDHHLIKPVDLDTLDALLSLPEVERTAPTTAKESKAGLLETS